MGELAMHQKTGRGMRPAEPKRMTPDELDEALQSLLLDYHVTAKYIRNHIAALEAEIADLRTQADSAYLDGAKAGMRVICA